MILSLYLLITGLLIVLSVVTSNLSMRYGIPALLIFLGLGMLFGSDGLNIVAFDDNNLAQALGIIALAYILFSGGLDTDWERVKPVVGPAMVLSTGGVLISALIVGGFVSLILNVSFVEGLLMGAIISSTDAAAVFSVLRSKSVGLKYNLKELIEFESATNDPMAIILTTGLIQFIQSPDVTAASFFWIFLKQMVIGFPAGVLLGKGAVWAINYVNLRYDGLYPVLALSFVPLIYAGTDLIGGNGFLAVYLAGLIMGNSIIAHRRSLMNFFDGISWLMQIAMFLTLGLLVYPSSILGIWKEGLLIALVLILLGRPVSIFLGMLFTRYSTRAKLMVSWVGLRGAVPIILATFPLVAGIQQAELFFSIVFFIVVTSVLLQGTTIPMVARLLGVDAPIEEKTRYPIELEPSVDTKTALKEIVISDEDLAVGKQILELGLPENVLVTLINREGRFFVPRGTTEIQQKDKLLILTDKKNLDEIQRLISG